MTPELFPSTVLAYLTPIGVVGEYSTESKELLKPFGLIGKDIFVSEDQDVFAVSIQKQGNIYLLSLSESEHPLLVWKGQLTIISNQLFKIQK